MDGGPRGRSDWWRGHEEQGAVSTGGVMRVQSKCWPDTWERLDPIVVYRCGGTDKQKDLYKSHTPKNYCTQVDWQWWQMGKQISKNS